MPFYRDEKILGLSKKTLVLTSSIAAVVVASTVLLIALWYRKKHELKTSSTASNNTTTNTTNTTNTTTTNVSIPDTVPLDLVTLNSRLYNIKDCNGMYLKSGCTTCPVSGCTAAVVPVTVSNDSLWQPMTISGNTVGMRSYTTQGGLSYIQNSTSCPGGYTLCADGATTPAPVTITKYVNGKYTIMANNKYLVPSNGTYCFASSVYSATALFNFIAY